MLFGRKAKTPMESFIMAFEKLTKVSPYRVVFEPGHTKGNTIINVLSPNGELTVLSLEFSKEGKLAKPETKKIGFDLSSRKEEKYEHNIEI